MARQPTPPTDASRADYHHGDLRRALLDATLRLVELHGPQGFTLRAAARAAGVTAGAPYHHFKDKDALLGAVAAEGFELFRAALEGAAARPTATPRQRMRNVGVAYVLFAVEHPTRFRVMLGYGVQSRMRDRALAATAVSMYEFVRGVLIEGLESGSSEPVEEPEVLGWWSVVHGLAFLTIDGHLGKLSTSAARSEKVVRAVLAALDRRERTVGG